MACDRFFHILQFLHFENNDDLDYKRLWKIQKIFDSLNNKFCEMYNLTEHFAVDEVIMFYKRRVIFWQYVPFGIKIYKCCNFLGCTYDMNVYLGKQWHQATAVLLLWGLVACYRVNCTFTFTFTSTLLFVI